MENIDGGIDVVGPSSDIITKRKCETTNLLKCGAMVSVGLYGG